MKKAIISVIGKDCVGIIYRVSAVLAEHNVNILDISQTILNDMFTMMMITDIQNMNIAYDELSSRLAEEGKKIGVEIRIQLEDIFEAMHRI